MGKGEGEWAGVGVPLPTGVGQGMVGESLLAPPIARVSRFQLACCLQR